MATKNYTSRTTAVATVGNSESDEVAVCEYNGTVTSVTYTPDGTITGAATNNRTVQLVNKGQSGAGSTVIATLNFANGTNATAGDEKTIPLSGTPANLVVAAGDVLEWQSNAVGTGIADPGGLVKVNIDRTYS